MCVYKCSAVDNTYVSRQFKMETFWCITSAPVRKCAQWLYSLDCIRRLRSWKYVRSCKELFCKLIFLLIERAPLSFSFSEHYITTLKQMTNNVNGSSLIKWLLYVNVFTWRLCTNFSDDKSLMTCHFQKGLSRPSSESLGFHLGK